MLSSRSAHGETVGEDHFLPTADSNGADREGNLVAIGPRRANRGGYSGMGVCLDAGQRGLQKQKQGWLVTGIKGSMPRRCCHDGMLMSATTSGNMFSLDANRASSCGFSLAPNTRGSPVWPEQLYVGEWTPFHILKPTKKDCDDLSLGTILAQGIAAVRNCTSPGHQSCSHLLHHDRKKTIASAAGPQGQAGKETADARSGRSKSPEGAQAGPSASGSPPT